MDNLEQTLKAMNSIVQERVLARTVKKASAFSKVVQTTDTISATEVAQESIMEPRTIRSRRSGGLKGLMRRLKMLWLNR